MTNKFNDAKWRREQLTEGKGYDLAKKYIAKLRQEFRKLSDEELDEFNEEIANAFGYKLIEGKLKEEKLTEEYIELMRIDKGLKSIKKAWEDWRKGPATNYEDVPPAYKELEKYIAKWLNKNLR